MWNSTFRKKALIGISALSLVGIAAGIWSLDSSSQAVASAVSMPAGGYAAGNYASLVSKLSHGNLHLLHTFPGPDGLTGIVAAPADGKGPKTIAWGINGKLLIPGPVLDLQGKNLTLQAAQQQGLLPKPMGAEKLAADMMRAPGFVVGDKGPMFTVFLDPNCIFCHKFWQSAYPLAQAGKLRFKVVPVGFLKPTSLSKAATILQSRDPAQAWEQNEVKFDAATEEGGTVPGKDLAPDIMQKIQANTELLGKSGEVATPTIVACMDHQKVPQVFHGITAGMLQDLQQAQSLEENGQCS